MIKTKKDLERYLEMDRLALGHKNKKAFLVGDYRYKFMIALRHHEYYNNIYYQNGGVKMFTKLMLLWYRYRHYKLGYQLGFEIPINTCEGGLRINHSGLIIINPYARIGKYCDIHQGVNIGQQGPNRDDCPIIGNNVWIGPGAKIFGKIRIADNCQIGANAVVNKSFEEPGISIAGVPAKKIGNHPNPNIRKRYL